MACRQISSKAARRRRSLFWLPSYYSQLSSMSMYKGKVAASNSSVLHVGTERTQTGNLLIVFFFALIRALDAS